jgi:hypothetical protein
MKYATRVGIKVNRIYTCVSGWPGAVDAPSRVCVRRPGRRGGRGRKLLHAPPAFACEGAWVVAGEHCCIHPRICVRGGVGDRGALLHGPPVFACEGVSGSQPGCRMHPHAFASERGVGVRAAGHCCALHAFASVISSPEGEAVEAPQQHGRGHVQGQLACTKATDQA